MKKTILAMVVGFIVQLGGLFLIHGLWLKPDYAATASVWRTQQGPSGADLGAAAGHSDLCGCGGVDLCAREGNQAVDRAGRALWHFAGASGRRLQFPERVGDSASAAPVGGEVDS